MHYMPVGIFCQEVLLFHNKKKFRVVVIDYPIFALDDSFCSNLLGKALKMKFDGYEAAYGNNILPMDKADFFGTHILFCEETDNELIPIFAYKATPLDRCIDNCFEFPGLTLMKADGDPGCVDEINRIIAEVNAPELISFDSSWAQNLDYRQDPELKEWLKEIMMMVIVKHHEEFNIPHMITCGVVKVKTDQFFLKIGLNKLTEKAHFYQKNLKGAEAVIFYNNKFSLIANQMAFKHAGLWRNKLLIDGLRIRELRARRAA